MNGSYYMSFKADNVDDKGKFMRPGSKLFLEERMRNGAELKISWKYWSGE